MRMGVQSVMRVFLCGLLIGAYYRWRIRHVAGLALVFVSHRFSNQPAWPKPYRGKEMHSKAFIHLPIPAPLLQPPLYHLLHIGGLSVEDLGQDINLLVIIVCQGRVFRAHSAGILSCLPSSYPLLHELN